ncbi:IGHG3 protein, partial [Poecile atricapillus]|nr:IGHG3 protein [Poecile atricapillus]NWZ88472.1 IGHG3 protein [Poecile atricapillus]
GTRLPPSVFLLPPPPEEISGPRPSLSLTCLARGFFPEAIDIQWHRDGHAPSSSGPAPEPEVT